MAAERASVSPPSLAQDPNLNAIRERASEPGSKYAFLVHSTDSLKNGEDPSIDNKPLARQKRRRTSPEDQAILEAAFLHNPKPDKSARMALVEKVALGEKEVQIWFQNRRQSTRRKQRPLEPHEIPALAHAAGYSSPYTPMAATEQRMLPRESRLGDDSPTGRLDGVGQTSGSAGAAGPPELAVGDKENTEGGEDPSQRVSKADASSAFASFTEVSSSQPFPSSQESNSGRWLSNRRSAAPFRSFHESISQATEPDSPPASQESTKDAAPSRQGLKKSASVIRLSFGADGSAIVRNGDSPSPPRKLLPPPTTPGPAMPGPSLQRKDSNASLNEPGSQESSKSRSLRRVSSFRSHDSRTWEFFCDREVRSELGERAEQEQSGSAADAIKLARSNSGKSGLRRSLSNKRTITPYAEVSSSKRVRTAAPADVPATTPFKEPVQPLQQKSLSASNPRRAPPSQTPGHKPLHKTPKLKQTPTFEFPATDSDKENWSPERHMHFIQSMTTSPAVPPTTTAKRRAPVAHTPLRRGISPSKGGSSSSSSNVRRRREPVEQIEDDDDDEDDEDEEVARFMGETGSARREEGGGGGRNRQSRQSDSVSEEEDLAGVQGLLSLSQGAWR